MTLTWMLLPALLGLAVVASVLIRCDRNEVVCTPRRG